MRLEDIEGIKQLKPLYCEICHDDHNPDRIISIFTTDGIWEGKFIDNAKDHQEIQKLFEPFNSIMSFSRHLAMNPGICVEEDTPIGTWCFFCLLRIPR